MLERDLQKEINRINGALEMLALLRERLEMQLDEVADETGQEALDETLSYTVALRSEFLRRQQTLHPPRPEERRVGKEGRYRRLKGPHTRPLRTITQESTEPLRHTHRYDPAL